MRPLPLVAPGVPDLTLGEAVRYWRSANRDQPRTIALPFSVSPGWRLPGCPPASMFTTGEEDRREP